MSHVGKGLAGPTLDAASALNKSRQLNSPNHHIKVIPITGLFARLISLEEEQHSKSVGNKEYFFSPV